MAVLYMALHENHIFKCLILYTIKDLGKLLELLELLLLLVSMWKQMNITKLTKRETLFAASPSNPAQEVTFPPNYADFYEQKPKAIKSFGIRI